MINRINRDFKKILIIQTAFAGDVILTLPLPEAIKEKYPDSEISFMCIPGVKSVLKNNPFISEVIVYDKKDSQRGILQFHKFLKYIKSKNFDLIISPHRSFRSTMLSHLSKVPNTISFDTSSYSSKYKTTVKYKKDVHEIIRNLSLLEPLRIISNEIIPPKLYPAEKDFNAVANLLKRFKIEEGEKFITIAPGSVWFTKTFPDIKFVKLVTVLNDFDVKIVIVGGEEDSGLGAMIKILSRNFKIYNAAGKLDYVQSAELIKRSKVLITNDSAPMHLANAVGTQVLAIFGATIPGFGFYPYGKNDKIFQIEGLKCRPCGIHGGKKCPVKTFDCMNKLDETLIALEAMKSVIS